MLTHWPGSTAVAQVRRLPRWSRVFPGPKRATFRVRLCFRRRLHRRRRRAISASDFQAGADLRTRLLAGFFCVDRKTPALRAHGRDVSGGEWTGPSAQPKLTTGLIGPTRFGGGRAGHGRRWRLVRIVCGEPPRDLVMKNVTGRPDAPAQAANGHTGLIAAAFNSPSIPMSGGMPWNSAYS